MRWDDLSVMLAVFRHGSMGAAGEEIGVDASTVSRRLRALEEALGGTLFDRTPDGLLPTDLVLRLLPHAEQAEAAAHAVAAEAAGTDRQATGRVRVAVADAFAAYVIAPQVGVFLDAHPGLELELIVGTRLVDLTRREADVALRFVRPDRGDLVAKRIASSGAYGTVVSRRRAESRGSADALHWIGWSDSQSHLPEAQLYQRVVGHPPRLSCDNLIVMIEALRHGAGAMLLPRAMGNNEPEAVFLEEGPSAPEFEVPVWLVTHRALQHVPRVRLVWDWLESLVLGLDVGESTSPG